MTDHETTTHRINRRSFLQGLGGAGAAALRSLLSPAPIARKAEQIRADQDALRDADLTWGKAPCRYCGTGCGVEVGVKDGKAMAVRGDQASPVNPGLSCVKGYHLPAFLYGEDRLTHPIRRHPDGREEQISWDEALDLVASEFQKSARREGARRRRRLRLRPVGRHRRLRGAQVGEGRHALQQPRPQRQAVHGVGGDGLHDPVPERRAHGLLPGLRGRRRLRALGQQHGRDAPRAVQPHPGDEAAESPRQGVRIVDLATRRTPTSDFADLYIEFKPGTDLALANGILHLLVESGSIDQSIHRREPDVPSRYRVLEQHRLRRLRRLGRARGALRLQGRGERELPRRDARPSCATTRRPGCRRSQASRKARSASSPTSTAIATAAPCRCGAWASTSTCAARG